MFALVPSALEECGVSPTPAETGRTGPVSAPWAADSATRLAPRLAARRWSPDSARTLLSQRSAQATSSSTLLESLPRQSLGFSVHLDLEERLHSLVSEKLGLLSPAPQLFRKVFWGQQAGGVARCLL